METAVVDAHATRLLLQVSPPEACVDSSLGPYVTSILRESLAAAGGRGDATHDNLVELLESHCQISAGAAREVLSSIALAVRTGDVSDLNNGSYSSSNSIRDKKNNEKPTTRSRSKSLGAEPATYDVEFLGKILRDYQLEPPKQDYTSSRSPLGDSLNIATGGSFNSCGNAFVFKKERTKQRSVTFDESSTWCSSSLEENSQMLEPLDEVLGVHAFEPLEGILGVLDLEGDGDDETQPQSKQEVADSGSDGEKESETEVLQNDPKSLSSDVGATPSNLSCQLEAKGTHDMGGKTTRSFPQKHASRRIPKSTCKNEANDLAAALFRPSRPRSNSLNPNVDRKNQKPNYQSEASDLVASLFRPSRPRSNSHMDTSQRPLSPSLTPPSLFSSSSSGVSSQSPLSGGLGTPLPQSSIAASKHDVCTLVLNKNASANSAEFKSTVQLLLTMNSHLGHEAASLATQSTDGDLNLAQYLIEAARSDSSSGGPFGSSSRYQQRRSRLCRHELRGTCYRADCPYSHDFSGVTCLFWLKGRCREGNCRFLHGFAEGLLEGICKEYLVEQRAKRKEEEERKRVRQLELEEEEKNKIHTTNLLDHNQWSDKFPPALASSPPENGSPPPLFGGGCWTSSSIIQ